MPGKHRLIGAEVSYYTGKVRAYLRYKGIEFEEVAATRDVYRELILPRTGVRFIPVLISDDDVAIQDSSEIIDFLERRYPDPAVYPEGAQQRLAALLFELYADEWLVLPAMHYRWNVPENRAFAVLEFGRLSMPQASEAEQRALGETLSVPFAGALPALGVHAATVPAIEASYHGFLAEWAEHLAQHPYLLGSRPSLGDFALFGPLYAHLYRDPASGRTLKERAPRVADWVERLRDATPRVGEWLPDDVMPATLLPILARLFREQGPVLASTIRALMAFEPEPADAPLPRALGTHGFRLGDAEATRAIFPFNAWRWQRAYDHYHRMSAGERVEADRWLDQVGGRALLNLPLTRRLERHRNRLRFTS
jgi:glutathione S-transferase